MFGRASEVLRLEDIEQPTPAQGEVLIRVNATSANPYDWHFIRGEPWFMRLGPGGLRKPKQPVPGGDFAGVVEALGSGDVGGFEVGDEVYGFSHGTFAEYVAAPHGRMARKPQGLTWEEAASLPLAAATAWQGLRDVGDIQAGDKVLIIGASGGIGALAVQMAVAWGAQVTGVCSTPNVELVASLGAEHVIDYRRDDFLRGEERYDLAFQLGGTTSPFAIRKVLTEDGALVQCAGDGSKLLGPILNVLKAMVSNRFLSQKLALVNTVEDTATLDQVGEMVEAGQLRPVIDHAVDFEDAGFAVDEVETGSPRGKIVISGYGREAPLDQARPAAAEGSTPS
jgi:NADPH:quinone reductase-like Zn-dependent oxidoreductase